MATQTGSYDFNAAKKAYDAGSTKATSFIFKTTGKDAWVCDENHGPQMSGANAGEPYGPSSMTPTTGWRIGDMFDMVRIGVSWFRVWVESGVAKMRLGRSDASHITLDSNGMDVSDGTDSVAAFGATGRIGKANGSRFVLESAKLQAYNSSNVKYFEVSASGMTFGTDTVATTDDIPTKVSDLTNDSSFATTSQLPTKVSDLTNDSHFATTSQLPTKTSDLTNDSSFATTGQLPTKTSDLTNDSSYATTSQLPTKVSDLTNDSNFATSNDVSTAKSAAEKVATNFIQNVTSGGVFVHRSESGKNGSTPTATNAYGVHIADDVDIIKAGVSVAKYGDTARVGRSSSGHIMINSSGMDVLTDDSTSVASFGASARLGNQSGYHMSFDGSSGSMSIKHGSTRIIHITRYANDDKAGLIELGPVSSITGSDFRSDGISAVTFVNCGNSNVPDSDANKMHAVLSAQTATKQGTLSVSPDSTFISNELELASALGIPYGGTGATTASAAWTALGGGSIGKKSSLAASDIPNISTDKLTSGVLGTARGGTGTADFGAVVDAATNPKSNALGSGSGAAVNSITLAKGTWIVFGTVEFASNASGRRQANISTSSGGFGDSVRRETGAQCAPMSGSTTNLQVQAIVSPSSSTTYYLNAYQSSGSSLTTYGFLRALRIK